MLARAGHLEAVRRWMMRQKTISRHIAWSRTGQRLFGADWIGKLPDKEYRLVQEFGPRRATYRIDGALAYRNIVPRVKRALTKEINYAIGLHVRSDLQRTRVFFR